MPHNYSTNRKGQVLGACAWIAQIVERSTCNAQVVGAEPIPGSRGSVHPPTESTGKALVSRLGTGAFNFLQIIFRY